MRKTILRAFRNSYLAALVMLATSAFGQLKPIQGPGQLHEALKTLKAIYLPFDYRSFSITGAADSGRLTHYQNAVWHRNDTGWRRLGYFDEVPDLSLVVKYADTAAMLNPYLLKADTVTLSNRIDEKVPSNRTVTAGTGLTGGGDLSADRTLTIDPSYSGFIHNQYLGAQIGEAWLSGKFRSERLFLDSVATIGDDIRDRYPRSGEVSHAWEITTDGVDHQMVQFTNYSNTGGFANLHFRKARGTKSSPLAIQSGDFLASWGFRGYDGSNFSNSTAAFLIKATENWTTLANGTAAYIEVQGNGTTFPRSSQFVFDQDGQFYSPNTVNAPIFRAPSYFSFTGNGQWQFGSDDSGNGASGNQFYIYEVGNTYRFSIQKGTGNLGINTVSPTEKLHVAGNAKITGTLEVGGVKWVTGAGTPEGALTAPVGSFYSRIDGGSGTTLYVKESGSGNTGWVAK